MFWPLIISISIDIQHLKKNYLNAPKNPTTPQELQPSSSSIQEDLEKQYFSKAKLQRSTGETLGQMNSQDLEKETKKKRTDQMAKRLKRSRRESR